jgi:hypothetical protein
VSAPASSTAVTLAIESFTIFTASSFLFAAQNDSVSASDCFTIAI